MSVEATTLPSAVSTLTDQDVAERHRRGDPRAFDEVYQRYAGMIYNLALRLTGSPEEAADLLQDTFLRVFRHLGGFRGRSSLKTWVFRVGLNLCRSRFARRPPEAQPLAEQGAEGVAALPDPARGPAPEAPANPAAP